jgi:hypothetical protein
VVTPRSVDASLTPKIASSASSTPSKVLTVAPGGTARAVTRATPFGCVTPAGSELGDAIEAIMLAVGSEPLAFSFVPHPSMPPQSSTTMPETSSAQQLGLGDAEVAEPGESPVAAGYRWVGHAYTRLRGSSPAAQRLPEVALGVQSSSAAVGKNAF